MKFVTSIHNDDMKCFHVVVQKIDKLVVMGNLNFEHHALIKRWWVSKKNECNGWDVQGQKWWSDHQKQFVFVVGSCTHFQSFGVHSNMNAKSAIEKL